MKLLKCYHCGSNKTILYGTGQEKFYCADCYIGLVGNYPPIIRADDIRLPEGYLVEGEKV